MPEGDKGFDFERRMQELEALVELLEDGDLPLEESLRAFEKGVRLTRECQKALSSAEQRVQMLIEENGELTEAPFSVDDDDQ